MTPQEILDASDLIAIGVAGDECRRGMHGARTTFNRVFEVHVDAPAASLPAGLKAGEVRIVGRPSSLDVLTTAVRALAQLAPGTPVTVFSVADLLALPHSIRSVAEALKEAGASAIVQLPVDSVENPELVTLDIRAAGLPVLTIGVEVLADERRLEICQAAANLQTAIGGFHAFAPLPRRLSVTKPTTGYDDVKTIALARVVAANVPSIQVDWQLYGPKMAQVALTVGADDIDGVAAVDPGILGTRRSPLEEIRGNIKAAALEPIERDGLFTIRQA